MSSSRVSSRASSAAPSHASPAAPSIVERRALWSVGADVPALDRAAQAWTALAGQTNVTADELSRADTRHWAGAASTSHHTRRKRLTTSLDQAGDRARAAGRLIAGLAGALDAAQDHLDGCLRRARTAAPSTIDSEMITFHPANGTASAAVLAEIGQAGAIRGDLSARLQADAAGLRVLAREFQALSAAAQPRRAQLDRSPRIRPDNERRWHEIFHEQRQNHARTLIQAFIDAGVQQRVPGVRGRLGAILELTGSQQVLDPQAVARPRAATSATTRRRPAGWSSCSPTVIRRA